MHVIITNDGGDYQHEFFTMSLAQDTDGNVWLIKFFSHMADVTALLGGPFFKSMFMPAKPAVGLPAGITLPEDSQNYCRIVEVGVQSLNTSFYSFNNCIKVNCYNEDPDDTKVDYYCNGFGNVRGYIEANPGNVLDLKDYGTSQSTTRAIIIPLSD